MTKKTKTNAPLPFATLRNVRGRRDVRTTNLKETSTMENSIKTFVETAVKILNKEIVCGDIYDKRKKTTRKLPISKIDNVDVCVEIALRMDTTYLVRRGDASLMYWDILITHPTLYLTERDTEEVRLFRKYWKKDESKRYIDREYNIEELIDEFKNAVSYLSKLRVYDLYGVFIDPSKVIKTNDFNDEIFKLLKDDKGAIKLDIDDCCVCYSPTYTKTGCEHHVCISCISKIEKVYVDEDNSECINCPMCREEVNSLGYVNYDWELSKH